MSAPTQHHDPNYRLDYEQIVDTLPGIPYTCLNDSSWTMQYMGPQTYTLTGYRPEELIDNTTIAFIELIYPEDRDKVSNRIANQLAADQDWELEYRIQHKDGHLRWIWEKGRAIRSAEGEVQYLTGFLQDITDKKQAEESLHQFKLITDNAVHGAAISSLEGKLLYINNYFAQVHGYTPDELIGKNLSIFHSAEQMDQVQVLIREMVEKGKPFSHVEVWHTHRDGRTFPMLMNGIVIKDNTGKPTYISATAIDITQRKRAELALAQSEEKYRMLIEHQSDLVVKVNPDGIFEYVSPTYCKLFGKKEEELLQKSFIPLIHEDDQASTATAMEQLYHPPYTVYLEQRAMTIHGWRWLSWQDTAVLNEKGEVQAIIGVGRDITQRKQAELDLKLRFEFTSITARLANKLNAASSLKAFNREIQIAIENLGHLFQVGRSYLFQFTEDLQYMSITHEWVAEGVTPEIQNEQNHPTASMPWWMDKMIEGKAIQIPDVSNLPPEAAAEKAIFKDQDIQALICLPTVGPKGTLMGFIGMDRVDAPYEWTENEVIMLQLVSDIIGTVQERRRIEKALKESEHRFRALFHHVTDAIYLMKWQADGKFDHFELVNQSACSMLGYTMDEFQSLSLMDVNHPDTSKEINTEVNQRLLEDGHYQFEVKHRHKEGHPIPVEVNAQTFFLGKQRYVLGVARDISERKNAEKRIRLQASALNSADNGIVISDKDGDILWVNPAWTKLTGFSAEESIGRNPRILKSGKHETAFYTDLWDTIIAGQPWQGEIINKRKDGTLYHELQTITPIRLEGNEITHFISIKQDISARMQYEKQIKEQLEILKEIAWQQSHKFRRPVANLLGLVEMMKKKSQDNSHVQHLEYVYKEIEVLDGLIRDVVKQTEYNTLTPNK